MGEPTHPNDWHAKTFEDAAFWRAQAGEWEALAEAAQKDGDRHHAAIAKRHAADCRHNARLAERESPAPPEGEV